VEGRISDFGLKLWEYILYMLKQLIMAIQEKVRGVCPQGVGWVGGWGPSQLSCTSAISFYRKDV